MWQDWEQNKHDHWANTKNLLHDCESTFVLMALEAMI